LRLRPLIAALEPGTRAMLKAAIARRRPRREKKGT
jgi:hypothetical protein